MATVTPNLGLTLPIGSEKVSRSIINGNMSIIDTFCGDINKSTLRDVPFAIAVNDWTSVNGQWVAEFTTAYVTASSKEIGYYDNSIVSYAKAHILMEKKSGGGGMVFTTAKKPSGLIQGNILVFDNDDLKIPVLIEDTVVPIANGGTGQSTLAGAKQALGITALADQIGNLEYNLYSGNATLYSAMPAGRYRLSAEQVESMTDKPTSLTTGLAYVDKSNYSNQNFIIVISPYLNKIFVKMQFGEWGSWREI